MANLKSLAKDTAIYGLSSIVGRFLNYLLMPLYTHVISAASGGYGVVTNLYAYTALILIILIFGMETTLFRFANKADETPDTVFSTALSVVGVLSAIFLAGMFAFITPISEALGYAEHPEYLLMMSGVVVLDAIQAMPLSYLRFQKKSIKFASLKLLFIILNIVLNVFYFVVLGKTDVSYVFSINLWCTGLITFFFVPDFLKVKWHFDWALLKRMLSYSWPILLLGVAGILNQAADKILFPLIYKEADAQAQLGIYGACVKVAMIMALITQAFRYAYEPIVFSTAKEKDSKEYYAHAMKYFIIFTLFAFLCVIAFMDVLQYLVGEEYRQGLVVVPIVMVAEIMMGIYFNLSFWYKLIDKTIWGAFFSLAGCAVLIAVNVLFIPRYGYMACAWGGCVGYGTAMLLSYAVGQKCNPIRYDLKGIFSYIVLAAVLYVAMTCLPQTWPTWLRLILDMGVLLLFLIEVVRKDLPLHRLPVIGKKFKKR
ncbi:MAG: lipopolysaccharide biosynthesis protein [Bacteroidales bacterium]|nr:lipopolysaccharide biosynthesis protein [Bacteroidales bacterium]